MPIIVWNGAKDQAQRVSTITLVKAAIAQLELGLRWLHDRAFWTALYRDGNTCYACGKYVDPALDEVNSLELGLRWLNDACSVREERVA